MNFFNKLNSFVKLRYVFLAFFSDVVFMMVFYMPSNPIGRYFLKNLSVDILLDMQKGYSSEFVQNAFSQLGELGRSDYFRNLIVLDMIYPIICSIFYSITILYIIKKLEVLKNRSIFAFVIGFSFAFCDIAENIVILNMLKIYPVINSELVKIGSILTFMKWLVSYSLSGLILTGFLVIGIKIMIKIINNRIIRKAAV